MSESSSSKSKKYIEDFLAKIKAKHDLGESSAKALTFVPPADVTTEEEPP